MMSCHWCLHQRIPIHLECGNCQNPLQSKKQCLSTKERKVGTMGVGGEEEVSVCNERTFDVDILLPAAPMKDSQSKSNPDDVC